MRILTINEAAIALSEARRLKQKYGRNSLVLVALVKVDSTVSSACGHTAQCGIDSLFCNV